MCSQLMHLNPLLLLLLSSPHAIVGVEAVGVWQYRVSTSTCTYVDPVALLLEKVHEKVLEKVHEKVEEVPVVRDSHQRVGIQNRCKTLQMICVL